MAIFGRKKDDASRSSDASPPGAAGAPGTPGTPTGTGTPGTPGAPAAAAAEAGPPSNPEKAEGFFSHARKVIETGNNEYAITLYLQGMRHDPASRTALESVVRAGQTFAQGTRKPGPTKDQLRAFDRKGDVERYLIALLNWVTRPTDSASAVKAVDAAVKLNLPESAYWIAERAISAATQDAKPRKDLFVRLKDLMSVIGAFDLAVRAGQFAVQLDPSDAPLDAQLRNLSAQAAMSKGGYEDTGQQGGFRKNIRDLDAQRRVEESERIVKSGDATVRVLAASRADYEARPTDGAAVQRYVKALLESGEPGAEKAAFDVLKLAYEQLKEFRFRQQAGELRLRAGRRQLRALRERAAADPANEKAAEDLRQAARKLAEAEIEELRLCVDAYPTDLSFKYRLGARHFELGQYENAIGFLQEAQNDPKTRIQCLNFLGQSFLAMGWHTEAVESFRTGLEGHNTPKDELGLDLRYGLMVALQSLAAAERDLSAAEEAVKIASGIALQQFSYRDIKERRDALQRLAQELRQAR